MTQEKQKASCLQKASNLIIDPLERLFYQIGLKVGTWPLQTIGLSIIFVGLCGIGFIKFNEQTDPDKLWIPTGSNYFPKREWIDEHFPTKTRYLNVIIVADNVLTPEVLKVFNEIYHEAFLQSTDDGYNLTTQCFKYGPICLTRSVLELWGFRTSKIESLTQSEIIDAVSNVTASPLYYNVFDVENYLGGIERNSAGKIIKASAAYMRWLNTGDTGIDKMDTPTSRLEMKILNMLTKKYKGIEVYKFATRSFFDAAENSIQSDLSMLSLGYALLIVYVIVMLGRFNLVQQRIALSICGVACIGMCIVVSYGLASAIGIDYGPLHSILPFLLLGIGIDDMFIIVGALNNLTPEEREKEIPHKMAITMKHAGVSITVTSLTDVVAFCIGSSTRLPSLQSFCYYAAIGIFAVFLLQCSFFVACLTLDVRRQQSLRDACFCCYTHTNFKANSCSQKDLLAGFFRKMYSPLIVKLPVKIISLIITAALLGVNIWGFTQLKQNFDPTLFFAANSDPLKYTEIAKRYFPDAGRRGAVYCKNIDYFKNRDKLELLYTKMISSPYVMHGSTDSWFHEFNVWLSSSTNHSVRLMLDNSSYPLSERTFNHLLLKFMQTDSVGQRHFQNLKLTNSSPFEIEGSYVSFSFKNFNSSREEVEAMNGLEILVNSVGFPQPGCFDYARAYRSWQTSEIIQFALYRNIGLAFGAIFVVTLILIANIWTSILVFTCVVFTLVDLMGTMYLWGLTIDTVTCISSILAIGLAVDYSAHVGHTFMVYRGTSSERTQATLDDIGTAVWNGGISTFLAFVLLSGSSSYVFSVFFKVFFLVVLYGLWHGLVYLPALLSIIGPSPYLSADRSFSDIRTIAHSERHEMRTLSFSREHNSSIKSGGLPSNNVAPLKTAEEENSKENGQIAPLKTAEEENSKENGQIAPLKTAEEENSKENGQRNNIQNGIQQKETSPSVEIIPTNEKQDLGNHSEQTKEHNSSIKSGELASNNVAPLKTAEEGNSKENGQQNNSQNGVRQKENSQSVEIIPTNEKQDLGNHSEQTK